jgi:hypothetical protein
MPSDPRQPRPFLGRFRAALPTLLVIGLPLLFVGHCASTSIRTGPRTARESDAFGNIRTIGEALHDYRAAQGRYPVGEEWRQLDLPPEFLRQTNGHFDYGYRYTYWSDGQRYELRAIAEPPERDYASYYADGSRSGGQEYVIDGRKRSGLLSIRRCRIVSPERFRPGPHDVNAYEGEPRECSS